MRELAFTFVLAWIGSTSQNVILGAQFALVVVSKFKKLLE